LVPIPFQSFSLQTSLSFLHPRTETPLTRPPFAADSNFLKLFDSLLGHDLSSRLPSSGKIRLLDAWEEAKIGFQLDSDNPNYRISMSEVLDSLPEDEDGVASLRAGISTFNSNHGSTEQLSLTRQKQLLLPAELVHRVVLGPVVDATIAHVHTLLEDSRAKNANLILLVGGFSESSYFQEKLRTAFNTSSRTVLCAQNPGFCVNKGAALFGLYPSAFITERVVRYAYGVVMAPAFSAKVHNPITKVVHDGKEYADNFLQVLAKVGSRVKLNESVKAGGFQPVTETATRISFPIWRHATNIPESPPHFLQKAGWAAAGVAGIPESSQVGTVVVNCFDPADPRQAKSKREERLMEVELLFGRSEVMCKVTAALTGDVQYCTLRYD
jgi:hypothetical protein